MNNCQHRFGFFDLRGIRALPFAAAVFAFPAQAAAHPHVWIDAQAVLVVDAGKRVEAVRIVWRFDEFFSAFALEELNADGNDEITTAEKDELARQYVESLVEWNYMTELLVDKGYGTFAAAEAYSTDIEDGMIVLSFTLPLEEPVDAQAHAVALRMYDPTYYIAIEFAGDDAVSVEGTDHICAVAIDPAAPQFDTQKLSETTFTNPDQAMGFGSMFAETARLACE
jgi:ABC-type uncharacterized transport system substrate-binding protein